MRILVVGGTSGIGLSLCERLSAVHHVISISRHASDKLRALGVEQWEADVLDEKALNALPVPDELDGLVYCPGNIRLKSFRALKADELRHDFELNVMGAMQITQRCIKALSNSTPSSVLYFSTVAVSQGMPMHSSTAACKAALEGLSRSLAAEYAAKGVRFNVIAPSLVDTPLANPLIESQAKRDASDARHPMGRIGQADELADYAAFLLSDATWTTGQVLHVDGGLSSIKLFSH